RPALGAALLTVNELQSVAFTPATGRRGLPTNTTAARDAPLFLLPPLLVRSNQHRLSNDVGVHLRFDRSLVRLIKPAQNGIESVELMKVAMTANGRTRAAIGGPFPIIETHHRSRWQSLTGDAFGKPRRARRKIVKNPMHPRHLGRLRIRRVGIIDDENEALCPWRHPRPS